MPKAASTISQSSLLDLRSITAEHADKFKKEGKTAVKGQNRRNVPLEKVLKDPFHRPSPGLIKRMASEARNDAKRRHFQDDGAGPSDEQRREIMLAKARKYDALRKGDLSGLSERELAEASIDFERKWEEDGHSDHSSDIDESAQISRSRWDEDKEDDLEIVEYVDELGRTRRGTRNEAREAKVASGGAGRDRADGNGADVALESAYAEVLKSNVIHGEQSFFPVYEPDPEVIRAKYLAAEEEARAHHYDSTKEVRTKGAGQYQFSLDETLRATQMESLNQQRLETEAAQASNSSRNGLTKAQEDKKRKIEERKMLIEARRIKLLGSKEKVEEVREKRRGEEMERFLKGVERELEGGEGGVKAEIESEEARGVDGGNEVQVKRESI